MEKKKVLLIDEDIDSIDSIRKLTKSLPLSLMRIDSEKCEMELLRRYEPDLLIIDPLLAHINGFDFCREVRSTPHFANLPILLLSAAYIPDHEDILEFLPRYDSVIRKGPTSFLPKPLPKKDFLSKLKELLGIEQSRKTKKERNRLILIIDDNLDNIELLRIRLESSGCDVIVANDGLSGIESFRLRKPDLIFLDIQMSGMNGIETLKALRLEDPDTAIIMMTAYGSEQIAVNAMKFGANDYLTKPLDHRNIISIIDDTLHKNMLRVKNRQLMGQLKETVKEIAKKYQVLQETFNKLEEKQAELIKMQKLAAITETAVSINHEINNPLCSILGNAELLIRELEETGTERMIKKLKIIEKESIRIQQTTRRLATLIDPILTEYTTGIRMIDVKRSRTEEDVRDINRVESR
jgi:CheY-like chemotaxis protein